METFCKLSAELVKNMSSINCASNSNTKSLTGKRIATAFRSLQASCPEVIEAYAKVCFLFFFCNRFESAYACDVTTGFNYWFYY